MSNENNFERLTIMGLDLSTVLYLIRQYQSHGVDVHEINRLRWELREEKLKLEALKDRIKELLETL